MGILGALGNAVGIGVNLLGAKKQRNREDSAIQRRVADANKAGINPLYALGVQGAQSSGYSVGSDFSDMGANLDRAVDSYRNPVERAGSQQVRVDSYTRKLQGLQLERAGLENLLLRSQIAVARAGSPPAAPGGVRPIVPGAGDGRVRSGSFTDIPTLGKPVRFPSQPGSDAQDVQNKYGDLVEDAFGIYKLGVDAYSAYDRWAEPRFGTSSALGKRLRDGSVWRGQRRSRYVRSSGW